MPDKNGVSLSNVGTDDMESLKVYVANTTPIQVESEGMTTSLEHNANLLTQMNSAIGEAFAISKGSSSDESVDISNTPSVKDLIGAKGNLRSTVPMGFIMLHNDLMDLFTTNMVSKKGKEGSNESDSLLGEGLSIFSEVKGILKGGAGASVTGGGISMATFGPAVANLGKLASFLTNPAVLGTAAAVGGIALLVNFIKNSEQRKAEDHMKHLMNELTLDMTLEDVKSNPEALQARNESFAEYVKSYYKQQILQMKLESFSNTMASLVVGQVGRTFRALIDSFKPEKQTGLQKLIEELDETTNTSELLNNQGIKDARDEGIAEYVKLYYKSQATQLTLDSAMDTFLPTNLLINGISSVFNTLVDTFTGKEDPLKEVITLLDESIQPSELTNNDLIKLARDEGIAEYVRTYYKAQTTEMKAENFGASIAGIFTGYASKIFSNLASLITGKEDKDSVSSKLSAIIEQLDASLDVSTYEGSPELLQAQKDGIKSFVEKYYELQADEILKANKESLGQKAIGWLYDNSIGVLTDLFKDKTPSENFKKAVTAVVSMPIDTNSIPKEDIAGIVNKNVLEGARAILEANNDALKDSYKSSITARSLKGTPLDSISNAYVNAIANTLNNAIGNVSDSVAINAEVDNQQTIEGMKYDDTNVLQALNDILQTLLLLTQTIGETMDNMGTNVVINNIASDNQEMLLEG